MRNRSTRPIADRRRRAPAEAKKCGGLFLFDLREQLRGAPFGHELDRGGAVLHRQALPRTLRCAGNTEDAIVAGPPKMRPAKRACRMPVDACGRAAVYV